MLSIPLWRFLAVIDIASALVARRVTTIQRCERAVTKTYDYHFYNADVCCLIFASFWFLGHWTLGGANLHLHPLPLSRWPATATVDAGAGAGAEGS